MAGDAAGTRHAVRGETTCLRESPRPGWCGAARSQKVTAVTAEQPAAQGISRPQERWASADAAGRPLCFGRRRCRPLGSHAGQSGQGSHAQRVMLWLPNAHCPEERTEERERGRGEGRVSPEGDSRGPGARKAASPNVAKRNKASRRPLVTCGEAAPGALEHHELPPPRHQSSGPTESEDGRVETRSRESTVPRPAGPGFG
uniref:Uncharacterized protein n=1 Tax=Rangifer tarandus platyrhynchus TaxID=3082113 RepID=A0ACB0E956_RANTA|nr:unnamed protein product [Rangifer tarandus platyrhynchus]